MFNRLPPEFGDTPTKVEFEGIDPGSPAARLLQLSYAGEVSSFLQKARQQRILSENGVSFMQQTLPDGGQLRYQYNNGMETLVVRLTPRAKSEALSKAEEKRQAQPSSLLAIDILFAPELYLTADIYSFEVETVEFPPVSWWDRANQETIYESFPSYPGTGTPSFAWVFGPYQNSVGPGIFLDGLGSGNVVPFDIDDHNQTPLSPFISYGGPHPLGVAVDWESWKLYFVPSINDGTSAGGVREVQTNARDQYSFFDVLNLAALRVEADPDDPASTPYEATSLGGGTGDKRLQPITVAGQTTVTRALVAAETAPAGFTGAGFIARPRKQQMDGDKAKPTVIDVYLASSNNLKANEFPGTETATFETDEPGFTYDDHKQLTATIRVREYIDGESPAVVGVSTTTQKRHKHFTAGTGGEEVEPTIEGEDEDSSSTRTVDWKFAAKSGWVDLGGQPADPSAEGMGQALADLTLTREVNAPSPVRAIRQTVQAMPVGAMTKVATIEWTPSTSEHQHGTASITPA